MQRLLPPSLVKRVYALYAATLMAFIAVSLAMFYTLQFQQHVEQAQASAQMLGEAIAQTVGANAANGDYSAIQQR